MPSIPITSALDYIGVFLLISGFFLIVTGFKILKIEKVSIQPGPKTWGLGAIAILIGLIFLLPEIKNTVAPQSPLSATATAYGILRLDPTRTAILRFKIEVDNTNVYDNNDVSANVIETVSKGQTGEIIDENGDWMLITYTIGSVRTTGWIKTENLSVIR